MGDDDGYFCSCIGEMAIPKAEAGRWVLWKPGDALPGREGESFLVTHTGSGKQPLPMVEEAYHYDGTWRTADSYAETLRNVQAWQWMPPPYEAAQSRQEAGEGEA